MRGRHSEKLDRHAKFRVARNMGATSRYEKTKNAARAHLVRERGYVDVSRNELVRLNRDTLDRRSRRQQLGFYGRARAWDAAPHSALSRARLVAATEGAETPM